MCKDKQQQMLSGGALQYSDDSATLLGRYVSNENHQDIFDVGNIAGAPSLKSFTSRPLATSASDALGSLVSEVFQTSAQVFTNADRENLR